MRDSVILYVNGKRHKVQGNDVFSPVTDLIRYGLGATGTKVVCAEGDCGACTVLLGRVQDGEISYKPVNACIQYIYQLDCTHLITVEGLTPKNTLNPVQQAMMEGNGAQCGYCTPGIVVAMCGLFQQKSCAGDVQPATQQEIRDTLTGNLCRCTGYEAILNSGMSVQPQQWSSLQLLYPSQEIISDFDQLSGQSIQIEAEGRRFYGPTSVEEAVALKAEHPDATLISGGTDVSVFCNKRHFEPETLIAMPQLTTLEQIEIQDKFIVVGARASLSQLETAIQEIYPEFYEMLAVFGSPQIKQAGTLAGNIANGSPIGDSLPFLFVVDAEVEATGPQGTRRINMNQLYSGYKTLTLKPDELITRVFIPRPQSGETLKLYKVSRRKHLDISTFAAAIRMQQSGGIIKGIQIAYGGVGPTVLRLPKTEAFLTGKTFTENHLIEAGNIARTEITPLSDVRGEQDFRYQLAANILHKFFVEQSPAPQEAHA